jgi:hypothetical protein
VIYRKVAMYDPEPEDNQTADKPQAGPAPEASIPIGIARIRQEWRDAGLTDAPAVEPEAEPVVFSEIDGGAGIGDYSLELDNVIEWLGLAPEAVDRLLLSGELDSILVQKPGEEARRLVSESSFERFRQDAAIDPDAILRAAKAMADQTLVASIEELRAEIEELKGSQGRILQQMKDILLLELRNLKEQDRDLTSFVYELAEEVRKLLPKNKRG